MESLEIAAESTGRLDNEEVRRLIDSYKTRASWLELKQRFPDREYFWLVMMACVLFVSGRIDKVDVPEAPVDQIIQETMCHMDGLYDPDFKTRRKNFLNLVVTFFDPSKTLRASPQPSNSTPSCVDQSSDELTHSETIPAGEEAVPHEEIEPPDEASEQTSEQPDSTRDQSWSVGQELPRPTYEEGLEEGLALQPPIFAHNKLAVMVVRVNVVVSWLGSWTCPTASDDLHERYAYRLETIWGELVARITGLADQLDPLVEAHYRETLARNLEPVKRLALAYLFQRRSKRHKSS